MVPRYRKGLLLIDVSLPDRHSGGHSAIKPSTTGLVFHRQSLTGLVIMRTCRDRRVVDGVIHSAPWCPFYLFSAAVVRRRRWAGRLIRSVSGGRHRKGIWRWCVAQMLLCRCTNRSRGPYIFCWLFPFVARRRVTAQAAVHISQASTLLPFIVSGASITWKHEAEGPNMKAGDDGILNKCCNWAPGPFFMCCVYLLRPDSRFTRASVR